MHQKGTSFHEVFVQICSSWLRFRSGLKRKHSKQVLQLASNLVSFLRGNSVHLFQSVTLCAEILTAFYFSSLHRNR